MVNPAVQGNSNGNSNGNGDVRRRFVSPNFPQPQLFWMLSHVG